MGVLFLTIVLTTSFFITFRFFPLFKVNTFHAIVINYTVCVLTGLTFTGGWGKIGEVDFGQPWVHLALFTGLLFLSTFFMMSQAVIKVSVTVAGIANKTALVIPVCASLFLFSSGNREFSWINYLGMGAALVAIVLSSWKQENTGARNSTVNQANSYFLPLVVFLGGGIVDTIVNFANFRFSGQRNFELYPILAFASAAAAGWFVILLRKEIKQINFKALAGGLLLGVPNYFSIYFLLKTLANYNNDGAIVFPVVNTGIIILTSLLAAFLFREKLSMVNLSGILIAILAIVFIFL